VQRYHPPPSRDVPRFAQPIDRAGWPAGTTRVQNSRKPHRGMMAAQPLTHHEILGLVEPFTRNGRRVDLAASNRLERRLVFMPVEHAGAGPDQGGLRETLMLESLGTGTYRLRRDLTYAGGARASLLAMGPRPADLLAQISAVPPRHQFRCGAGFVISRSYTLEPGAGVDADGRGAVQAILTEGVVRIEGQGPTLTLTVPAVRGVSAEITLAAAPGDDLALPEDLLAVLGWNWARLIRRHDGWKSKLRLRGNASARTHGAERALERAALHLAQTFAESPGRFHDRRVMARWGVVFRRAIPTLTIIGLLAAIPLLPSFDPERGLGVMVLIYHVPTVLIALSFCLQELAQFEIPAVPRRSRAATWRTAQPVAG
jgi:hypothetical protein